MVMEYVNVKHGRQEPRKIHPVVDEVLAPTNGVMCYQEQVMRILNRVGNIELSSAYKCIKAISKKKLKTIAEFREQYIEGSKQNGIPRQTATELFDLIEKFAGYGFNRSHSVAYGAVAYQTAYLKAHYPCEFMAALLSCGMEDSNRIAEHVDDCRRMKINVRPPDVNSSDVEFGVVGKELSFGLGAVKGVGESAVQAIVTERAENGPYRDIYDLTERIDPKVLNKAALETLIKAGALDSLGAGRARHMAALDRAVQAAQARQRDKARGQKNLFGGDDEPGRSDAAPMSLPEANDWTHSQKLAHEKEVLGFYLTSHPLTEHAEALARFAGTTAMELKGLPERSEVMLAGMVSAIKKAQTKKPSRNGHTRYVNFDFEDPSGVVRCIMWPEEFARAGHLVEQDALRFIKGRVDQRGREPNVIVDQIMTLEDVEKTFTDRLAVKFQQGLHDEQDMRRVRDVLARHPGLAEVVLVAETPDDASPGRRLRFVLAAPDALRVACTPELKSELAQAIGENHFKFHAAPVRKNGPARNGGR
jgi:DNA polymerase-3 subunit alpha